MAFKILPVNLTGNQAHLFIQKWTYGPQAQDRKVSRIRINMDSGLTGECPDHLANCQTQTSQVYPVAPETPTLQDSFNKSIWPIHNFRFSIAVKICFSFNDANLGL